MKTAGNNISIDIFHFDFCRFTSKMMYFSPLMTCLCFLFHPPVSLTRSADSVIGDLGPRDRASLGLSLTDIEELEEISHAAVRDEDVRKLEEVMMMMTEEELENLTSMSDEDLEGFYDEKLRKLQYEGDLKDKNKGGRNVLFRVGDDLVELEGLSDEDMKGIMTASDQLITEEELKHLKKFTRGMTEEDLDLISNMTDEELEHFYEENIASRTHRHKRETTEDDILSSIEQKGFEEDSLRISHSKMKREADPYPEPVPMGPGEEFQPSNAADRQEKFLDEYVKRFR